MKKLNKITAQTENKALFFHTRPGGSKGSPGLKILGAALKRERLKYQQTHNAVARFCKCLPTTVAGIESGLYTPSLKYIHNFCRSFNLNFRVYAGILYADKAIDIYTSGVREKRGRLSQQTPPSESSIRKSQLQEDDHPTAIKNPPPTLVTPAGHESYPGETTPGSGTPGYETATMPPTTPRTSLGNK